jgi:hypothetical protein
MKTNLGIAPAIIALIASVVVEALKVGYSYYQASMLAKEQAQLTRDLTQAEVTEIAYALSQQTNIEFTQWYNVLKLTYVPITPVPEPEPKPGTDWTMYIVFGVLGLLIFTRR